MKSNYLILISLLFLLFPTLTFSQSGKLWNILGSDTSKSQDTTNVLRISDQGLQITLPKIGLNNKIDTNIISTSGENNLLNSIKSDIIQSVTKHDSAENKKINQKNIENSGDNLTITSDPDGTDERIEIPGLPIFPSPNVAEMMKYTDFPVADQFGCIPIQIPLYTINSKDISHDITLSYHSGGIKVDQEATWVGLGWNLNVGGSVSRIVMDLPDDEKYNTTYSRTGGPAPFTVNSTEFGWLNNPDLIQNFPELDFETDYYKNALDKDWDDVDEDGKAGIALFWLNASNSEHQECKRDAEPDIFYINVGNLNIKFILGFDGEPKFLDNNQDIEIEVLQEDENSSIKITGFVVTDIKGNIYSFGGGYIEKTTIETTYGIELQEYLLPMVLGNYASWSVVPLNEYTLVKSFGSAWFLEYIMSPQGEYIEFEYEGRENLQVDIPTVNCMVREDPGVNIAWNSIDRIIKKTDTYSLSQIQFDGGNIHFTTSERTDLFNGVKLDNILINNNISNPIYSYDFLFEYMNPEGDFKEQRLILTDLIKNEIDKYSFQYYEGNLPAKNSFHQDLWGYYSARSTGWFPTIFISDNGAGKKNYKCFPSLGGGDLLLLGSDRYVDEQSILCGVLQSITYPTNGSTIFDFESNEFFDPSSEDQNIKGGGIRINQVRKLNEKGILKLKQSYFYTYDDHSSGTLIYDLAYATPTVLSQLPNSSAEGLDYDYSWYYNFDNPQIHQLFTLRFSHNCYPQNNLEGFQIGYTTVTIKEEGNGKLVREYYPPQNFSDNSSFVRTSPMNAWGYSIPEINDPLYFEETPYKNFSETCYSVANDYFLKHTAPGSFHDHPIENCNQYPSPSVITMPEKISYHGGGMGNFYRPSGYFVSNDVLGLESFQVFNCPDNFFRAYKTKYFFQNPPINSYESLMENCMLSVSYFNYLETPSPNWMKPQGYNIFPFPPLSNTDDDQLLYSKLKKELFFKEGDINPCKQIDYMYKLYGEQDNRVFGLKYQPHYLVSLHLKGCPSDAAGYTLSSCSFGRSYFFSTVHGLYIQSKAFSKYYYNVNCTALLKSVIETEYFPTGSLVKNTIYDYTDHYLLSYINESQSDNSLSEVKIKYPFNFSASPYTHMTNLRMLNIPIETIKLKDELVVGGTINTYRIHEFDIAPDKLFKYTSTTPVQYNQCSFDGSAPNTSYWNDIATFDYYDDKVKLLQYHMKDNIPITFLWGYNRTVPIAKIEGATYDEVINAIGISIEDLQTKTDEELRTIFTNLRTSLPSSRIISYTYIPLAGPSSNNDYNGLPTYYFYDGLNRLITIKDQDSYIQKHIEYHYYE